MIDLPPVDLMVLRHGPTAWSATRRLQGREDLPLSPEGIETVRSWRLPDPPGLRCWYASPLRRCVETARLLGCSPEIEPRLVEMDWGGWAGRTLGDIRRELGPALAEREALGLDFRPDGGESPRDVQARLLPWLAALAERGRPAGAVVHRGVLRALHALATGWDMTVKPPDRLLDGCAHRFAVGPGGMTSVAALNLSLSASAPGRVAG